MKYLDYNSLHELKKFNFTTKDQFNIDKILIEILAQCEGGAKQYEQVEAYPKLLMPKMNMRFHFPKPIPEEFFGNGNRAFKEVDEDRVSDIPWGMEKPLKATDDYCEDLKRFFKDLNKIRSNRDNYQTSYCYATLTNTTSEETIVFNINNEYEASTERNNMMLFAPELIDVLVDSIVKKLSIKKDKDLLKAFMYVESILYLNSMSKASKLKDSWGYIIKTSFYKACSMREVAICYDKILYEKAIPKHGDFKPFDVFKAKLKTQPKEYGLFRMYLDYMFKGKDDDFFLNFKKCIEKGNPLLNSSGKNFLKYMGVYIDKGRSSRALWMDLATKILNS